MNEIYWLTRLDAINTIFSISVLIGAIATFIFTIAYIINKHDEEEEWISFCKRMFNWSIPLLIVGALGLTFTPNTKEAFLIYGVGGSIDYLKENPTAKQLPDKVINIIDKWVDELAPEKKE